MLTEPALAQVTLVNSKAGTQTHGCVTSCFPSLSLGHGLRVRCPAYGASSSDSSGHYSHVAGRSLLGGWVFFPPGLGLLFAHWQRHALNTRG